MCFDLPAYLTRIGLNDCAPTLEGLRAVQMAQLIAIPFESVQPFLGQVPDVSPEGLWTKLVDERKGGFCFEVNTLFGAALKAIGFESRPVFCRVRMGAAQGGARSHLAHIVTIGGVNWLADAGFGGQTQPEPVRLGISEPQHLRDHAFRTFLDTDTGETVLERHGSEGWLSLYGFDGTAPTAADIEAATFLCATWPKMPFRHSLKFLRLTGTGSVAFLDGRIRRMEAGRESISHPETLEAFADFVGGTMGLGYDAQTIEALWKRLKNPA